jgi:hypothetical protein
MNDKKELYTIVWTQVYPNYQELIDQEIDKILAESEYKEANEIINRIKRMIN